MSYTPEQRQLLRWIDRRYDLDQIAQVDEVTRNAVRLALRGGEPELLILRQDGRIDRLREADLYAEPC